MANLTLDNLIDYFCLDFESLIGAPLQYNAAILVGFREKANQYGIGKFRAMWNIFIQYRMRKEWRVSLTAFLEPDNLNDCSVRFAKLHNLKPERNTSRMLLNDFYTCENSHPNDSAIFTFATEGGHGWPIVEELPDVLPDACPVCNGRWWRDSKHPNLVGRLADHKDLNGNPVDYSRKASETEWTERMVRCMYCDVEVLESEIDEHVCSNRAASGFTPIGAALPKQAEIPDLDEDVDFF